MPEHLLQAELLLPRISETNPIGEYGRKLEHSPLLPWRSSALERLQGKECLHRLAPKTPLVATEPVNEFIVEVHQTQVTERDVPRGTRRALATLGCKFVVSAAIGIGQDPSAGSGIRFTQQTRSFLASPF